MPEVPDASIPSTSPVALGEAPSSPVRKRLLLELAVVAAVGIAPALAGALLASQRQHPVLGTPVDSLGLIVQSVEVIAVVLFVMAHAPDRWSAFGIVRLRSSDWAWGFALLAAGFGGDQMIEHVFWHLGWWPARHAELAHGLSGAGWVLLVLAVVGTSFAEELVMRGYLIPRLESLRFSSLSAVLISSALFGAYHIYQGYVAALAVTVTGLLAGALFVHTRRLWPVVIGHLLLDLVAFALRIH